MCFSLWYNCFVKKRSLFGLLLWSLETLFFICFSYDNFIWKLVETFCSDFFKVKLISFFLSFFFFLRDWTPQTLDLFFVFFFFLSSFLLVSGCGIRYGLIVSETFFPPLFSFLLSRPPFTISDLLNWAFTISAKFCPRRCLWFLHLIIPRTLRQTKTTTVPLELPLLCSYVHREFCIYENIKNKYRGSLKWNTTDEY